MTKTIDGQLQELETLDDLELLEKGDVVRTREFGNIMYQGSMYLGISREMMIFLKKEKEGLILDIEIDKKNIGVDKGVLLFGNNCKLNYIERVGPRSRIDIYDILDTRLNQSGLVN